MMLLVVMLFSSPSVKLVDLVVVPGRGGAESFQARCGFTPAEEPHCRGMARDINTFT